ncbi:cell division protein FtsA [Riemerella columbipharyngis]|uniref:Cell division protein FtsA n=1 Tax=Riemerella columbipharyngis TaxID=1071918 RepID=A0A1G7F496_9FLAO|nr:cell division protein FtsA [Riemerella columbipharyngis]SDE70748.1 cell division protein FtsA [Riemerella columbipharyngis]
MDYSVGLDIGTTKIVVIVGRKNKNGKIEILGVGREHSLGVHNGVVNNVAKTIDSIKKAVAKAEQSTGLKIEKVTVGIAGKHIRSLQHSDYIMRKNPDAYIDEDDISALKKQVEKLVMLPGEQIIHVLPQEFKVDSDGDIKTPMGMHGTRLEANFHVVVGQIGNIKNIIRCVEEAGLKMESLTLEPLASAEAVLTPDEKEAGVAIIDIGGGTTDIAIFKDNVIKHTCVIPYGGGIITEDIKTGCSIIERYAEKIKVKFGSAIPAEEKDSTFVTIPGLHGRSDKEISLKSLAQIINARVEEILDMVNTEFKAYGTHEQKKKLIGGIVLTGGGSNLKNLRQLTNFYLGFDSRIGYANEHISNDKNNALKSPEYATAIGLLMESIKINEHHKREELRHEETHNNVENTIEKEKTEAAENNTSDSTESVEDNNKEDKKKSKKKLLRFYPSIGSEIWENLKKFFYEDETP